MTRHLAFPISVSLLLFSLAGCSKETLCPSDETLCDGACKALAFDPQNCGACGTACAAYQICSTGECQAGSAVADLFLACFNTNEVRAATRDLAPSSGAPVKLTAGPAALAWLDGALFVASASYEGGEAVTRIAGTFPSLMGQQVWAPNPAPIPGDIEGLAGHGGYLYVAHTSVGSLLVLSPDGQVIVEHPFAGANEPNPDPQGIAFSGDRAYVALNASNEVAVMDVSSVGQCGPLGACEITRIDVHGLASPQANAMPSRIAVVGGRAYVTLWNLDPNFNPPPGSTGRLAVVDLASNTLDPSVDPGGPAGLVDLGPSCLDPADLAVLGSTLYVTCGAFDYGSGAIPTIVAGGIVPIDLSGPTPEVGAILPAPADAAPGQLAFCSGAGYLADRNSGRVFLLDPVLGAVNGVELCPKNTDTGFAYVSDLACGF